MTTYPESLFHAVFNMSLTATVVIAFVLLVRLPLIKAPKTVSYGLWFVVLFRLLCPVSFASAISLFGLFGTGRSVMGPVPANIGMMMRTQVNGFIPAITEAVNSSLPAATPMVSVNPMQVILFVAELVWILGLISLLLYSVVSYLFLKRRISTATLVRDNIYRTDRIGTPFVCGLIKPKIYLPHTLTDSEQQYIIRHEQIHIRRRDYLLKPLWFLAVCLHWFNPLVWLSFYLMNKDMEMSCDEAVIREMGESIKTDYSTSLLTLSVKRQFLSSSPLAFGEGGTLSRVKNVLKYKRPLFWVVAVAVAVAVAAAAVSAANPKELASGPSLAKQFLKHQTVYVGNNSKVGNIIALLQFPRGVRYDSFALHTDSEPYGITVNLKTDAPSQEEYRSNPINREQFATEAAVMFALIDNLEVINFALPSENNGNPFVYSRILANERYGRDVREFAGNEEEFAKLLSGQAPTPGPVKVETSYALMKLGKNGKVLAEISSLSGADKKLAEDVIFNALIKSTIYEGLNIRSLDECYLIKATYTVNGSSSTSDYYAFMLDGFACLQRGDGNGYTPSYARTDNKFYNDIVKLMDGMF